MRESSGFKPKAFFNDWIPAFAGMTVLVMIYVKLNNFLGAAICRIPNQFQNPYITSCQAGDKVF